MIINLASGILAIALGLLAGVSECNILTHKHYISAIATFNKENNTLIYCNNNENIEVPVSNIKLSIGNNYNIKYNRYNPYDIMLASSMIKCGIISTISSITLIICGIILIIM
jgi:hypothetical protein